MDHPMAAARFMDSLDIPILQGHNFATVDLFDIDHAENVLTRFGQAFGRLPSQLSGLSEDEKEFLTFAASGLSQDGKVVSVRLALFAEMVKGKPWVRTTLEEVGGMEGIGVNFLEEAFSSRTANPKHRLHQEAARETLKALLPDVGTDIKGNMRSHAELLKASGYQNRPGDFNDLLGILDGELRLLTPTDPEGSQTGSGSEPSSKHFQLTHDYLVPSLREWLTRKQRETRRGRAELRLTERSALWCAKPENRHLPSVWEWANIRLLTTKRSWTEPQRKMMRNAGRAHLARAAVLLVVLLLLGWGGYEINGHYQAKSLVGRLLSAKEETVPDIIGQLQPYRRWARSRLEQQLAMDPTTPEDERRQLHARLALVVEDDRHVREIKEALLSAETSYVGVLRDALLPYSSRLIEDFRQDLQNTELPVEHRFRAGLPLATYDPVPKNWTDDDRRFLAEQLVAANPEHQPRLREYLRPIGDQLLVQLERLFTDPNLPENQQLWAANALADYAREDGPRLAHLISEATAAQYKILYPQLAKLDSAKGVLSELVATQPAENLPPDERVTLGKRRANAAITLLRQGTREEIFAALRVREDPESLTQFVHRCRAREVQPLDLLKGLDAADTLRQSKSGADRELEDCVMFALLLALGEYSFEELPAAQREPLVDRLATWYASDRSSAIHGATGWLLRHWNRGEAARKVDQTPLPYSPDREWYTLEIPGRATDSPRVKVAAEQDSVYLTFVVFQPGEYEIGSADDSEGIERRHAVRITRSFAVCDREITWAQFDPFDGGGHRKAWADQFGSELSSDDPVFGVSWFDAVGYCRWLTEQRGFSEPDQCYDSTPLDADQDNRPGWVQLPDSTDWPLRLDGLGFRLLTEAEWESVCRSGTETKYSFGSDDQLLKQYCWFMDNSNGWSHAVGQLRPTLRGLFDIHGNLREWCHDWYGSYEEDVDDPVAPFRGSIRSDRGGTWSSTARSGGRGGGGGAPPHRAVAEGGALTTCRASLPPC